MCAGFVKHRSCEAARLCSMLDSVGCLREWQQQTAAVDSRPSLRMVLMPCHLPERVSAVSEQLRQKTGAFSAKTFHLHVVAKLEKLTSRCVRRALCVAACSQPS